MLQKNKLLPYLFLSLAALLWSGNLIAGRAVYQTTTPISLTFWRWLIAMAILLPFEYRNIVNSRTIIVRNFVEIFSISMTGIVVYSILVYVSLHFTYALNSAMLLSMAPIFIVTISITVYKQSFLRSQLVGVLISFAGVLLIITRGTISSVFSLAYNKGDILMLIGVLLWAVYSLQLQKKTFAMDARLLFTVCILLGVFTLTPFYLIEVLSGHKTMISQENIMAILYMGIFAAVLGYFFWAKGIEAIGAHKAGLFLHLIPVFSSILAITMLDESIRWFHLTGFILVFIGIIAVNWDSNKRTTAA